MDCTCQSNDEPHCALQEQQQEHRQALDSLRSTLQREADLAKEGLQAAERQAGASEQQLASLHSSLAASEDRRRAAESQAEVSCCRQKDICLTISSFF